MSTGINRDPAEIQVKNVDPLVNFFAPHPPYRGFVANKERTAIQPDGRPSGRSLFSRYFDRESRSIFSAVPIAKFTLWLIARSLQLPARHGRLFAGFSKIIVPAA